MKVFIWLFTFFEKISTHFEKYLVSVHWKRNLFILNRLRFVKYAQCNILFKSNQNHPNFGNYDGHDCKRHVSFRYIRFSFSTIPAASLLEVTTFYCQFRRKSASSKCHINMKLKFENSQHALIKNNTIHKKQK